MTHNVPTTDDVTPLAAAPAAASAAVEHRDAIETQDGTAAERRCPWCSQVLPADATVRCPQCHANLVAGADARLPGLTEVEAPSATRARRAEAPRRSKLLSWISGEIDDDQGPPDGPSATDALAPPPRDVRREMLRLQLQADGLTVSPDGSIALPVSPAPSAPEGVEQAVDEDAAAETDPVAPAEIRKAS